MLFEIKILLLFHIFSIHNSYYSIRPDFGNPPENNSISCMKKLISNSLSATNNSKIESQNKLKIMIQSEVEI